MRGDKQVNEEVMLCALGRRDWYEERKNGKSLYWQLKCFDFFIRI